MTPRSAALLVLAALAGACGFEPAPAPMRFELSKRTLEAAADEPEALAALATTLEERFGTPQAPRYPALEAWTSDGIDPNRPDVARGEGGTGEIDAARLATSNRDAFEDELEIAASGDLSDLPRLRRDAELEARIAAVREEATHGGATSELRARATESFVRWYPSLRASAELYRQECLHCHGVEGGGDGPSAHFLEPRPRDVRLGVFKWTALSDLARPRRADLMRTLVDGLDGTSMPSFRRYSDAELEGLVDYVRFLAVRGEVEKRLADTIAEEGELPEDAFDEELEFVWGKWEEAATKLVAFDGEVPASTPALVARGKELFHDATKGNCSSCHGDGGNGNGPAAWKLDALGERTPAYLDVWGDPILPRDLTSARFRGGSRPIDLYRRIWAGIAGGPMPALGRAVDKDGARLVPDADIWALVHYVRSLSSRAAKDT